MYVLDDRNSVQGNKVFFLQKLSKEYSGGEAFVCSYRGA